jgi:hypothetical protein
METKENSVPFWTMMVILLFMFIACVVLPLTVSGEVWYVGDAKEGIMGVRLPLMGLALALPFIHFFVFAGIEIAKKKK